LHLDCEQFGKGCKIFDWIQISELCGHGNPFHLRTGKEKTELSDTVSDLIVFTFSILDRSLWEGIPYILISTNWKPYGQIPRTVCPHALSALGCFARDWREQNFAWKRFD